MGASIEETDETSGTTKRTTARLTGRGRDARCRDVVLGATPVWLLRDQAAVAVSNLLSCVDASQLAGELAHTIFYLPGVLEESGVVKIFFGTICSKSLNQPTNLTQQPTAEYSPGMSIV